MKVMVMTDILYHLKNIDEILEILIAERERDKRNEHNTNYNRGVNIIGVIDNCLGVTAIGLVITGVGLLSTIVTAPAQIGMDVVTIVMKLLRVVGNRAIEEMSLKIEKHEKNAMLAVSTLNTISSTISDEQYSLILLEFETFTRANKKAGNGSTY